jgi:hypothetical protein
MIYAYISIAAVQSSAVVFLQCAAAQLPGCLVFTGSKLPALWLSQPVCFNFL